MTNHQRLNAKSNTHAGNEFELVAKEHFNASEKFRLESKFSIELGVLDKKKKHIFDLGCNKPPVLVECKSHCWTITGNVPSAKMTVWNEAMYYFHLAPPDYRKILFVLKSIRPEKKNKKAETLAEYYARTHGHLIPSNTSIMEYDPAGKTIRSFTNQSAIA